jgi:cytoskeletal protein CcmA (bactofilin family)
MALFSKEPEKSVKGPVAATSSPAASTSPLAPSTPAPRGNGQVQGEGRALLDRGSKVTGKISFEGPARIDGEVDGELNGKDGLVIGDGAVISAQIRATSVTVSGKVSGDIFASQRIELRSSAKVQGNLNAPVLVIQEGAQFEGHCSMHGESAREERKVTVFAKEERLAQAAAGQKPA